MRGVILHRSRALLLGLIAALAMGPAVALAADPDTYSAAPVHGWVVDAETRQPLEGVHVVAQWILQTGLLHGQHTTRLHIMETVTDPSGAYQFPGWGPKPRPFLSSLDVFDPMLTFFKPGYVPLDRTNFHPPQTGALRTSVWDGRTIELRPFRGTPREWLRYVRHMQFTLAWGQVVGDVPQQVNDYWKYFPRTILSVLTERNRLPSDLRPYASDLTSWYVTEEQLRALAERKGVAP
jgi:hypothetical protein